MDLACSASVELQGLHLSPIYTHTNAWMSIHPAGHGPVSLLLFCNEVFINLLRISFWQYRCAIIPASDATRAVVLLVTFSGFKEKGYSAVLPHNSCCYKALTKLKKYFAVSECGTEDSYIE